MLDDIASALAQAVVVTPEEKNEVPRLRDATFQSWTTNGANVSVGGETFEVRSFKNLTAINGDSVALLSARGFPLTMIGVYGAGS